MRPRKKFHKNKQYKKSLALFFRQFVCGKRAPSVCFSTGISNAICSIIIIYSPLKGNCVFSFVYT